MGRAFALTLGEGCEAFMIVALSLAYLRRTGRVSLIPAVYWGIAVSLPASIAVAMLFQRASNQALWQGTLAGAGAVLAIWLANDLRHTVKLMTADIQGGRPLSQFRDGAAAFVAVFVLTVVMLTREGFEMTVLLQVLMFQVGSLPMTAGAVGGIAASGAVAWLWARYGPRVRITEFFQGARLFLLVFIINLLVYGFHELAEARLLPYSEAMHEATEPYSPDGLYGRLFPYVVVLLPTLWVGMTALRGSREDRSAGQVRTALSRNS
jgi:high-affinity iron transporter